MEKTGVDFDKNKMNRKITVHPESITIRSEL